MKTGSKYLRKLTIKNFKSITALTIRLGRINVFIGANNAGKTNILEAVGWAAKDYRGCELPQPHTVANDPSREIQFVLDMQPQRPTKSPITPSEHACLAEHLKDYRIYNHMSVGVHGENLDTLLANLSETESRLLAVFSDTFYSWNEKFILDPPQPLFYMALFCSASTPNFFAIDNIELGLGPQLCRELITYITKQAWISGKQALITTHNPAILDGLDLYDDGQRLFVVYRNDDGHTACKRIKLKPDTDRRYKLSELWMRGHLGGLHLDGLQK